ncbi:hypothetical protein CVT25_008626 [Psilocybe cyanescens]|uniref:Protein MON2 homolog n=1 Tax=Psilocybe cyanescens TaxID=93625 RepID=A0A409XDC0_PSICY|nr:hypothetical protein CVT25_008626 [Psilocybe cyanescens]
MGGIGVQPKSSSSSNATGAAGAAAYGLDMAGRVASASVSGVVTMIGSEAGLSSHGSSMKLQCIDQLDKAKAPAIPEASHTFPSLPSCSAKAGKGIGSHANSHPNNLLVGEATGTDPRLWMLRYLGLEWYRCRRRFSHPDASQVLSNPTTLLKLVLLLFNDPQTHNLRTIQSIQSIILQAWPALLGVFSFIISTNLLDKLFVEVLASYQAMTNVSGMLGLTIPRDTFFNSLSKFAVPPRVVSSLESWVEHPPPQTPRLATATLPEGLGLGSPTQPPRLSERNMACLKFAVPPRVVSSLESWVEHPPPQTPRSATAALPEGLRLGGPMQPPRLSERNMACLKVLLGCTLFLAGSLGESWYSVLEALQNADSVLGLMARGGGGQSNKKGLFGSGGAGPCSGSGSGGGSVPASQSVLLTMSSSQSTTGNTQVIRHPLLLDLDVETMQLAVQRLFDSSKNLEDFASQSTTGNTQVIRHPLLLDLDVETMQLAVQRLFDSSKNLEDFAFRDFVNALCKLSTEMVGIQTTEVVPINVSESGEEAGGGGMLMINKARRVVGGDQAISVSLSSKLGGVAMLNIHRLIYRSPDIAWNATTSHLLMIIGVPFAPQSIRIQAACVLNEILLVIPCNLSSTGELQVQVQHQFLDQTTMSVEIRRMGLEMLHQILQVAGHTLVVGWETIFRMLGSVCRLASLSSSNLGPIQPTRSRSTNSVSILSGPPSLVVRMKPLLLGLSNPTEKSYNVLVKIAFQSLTLSISDAIQSKQKNMDEEPVYSELWMFLLLEVLGLYTDPRAEYGNMGAMYMEDQPEEGVKHTWDESKILALYLIGSIFSDFLVDKIMLLIQGTRKESKAVDGKEWDLERLTTLMAILKGVLMYPHSPDYRPDIDALPPVQTIVMDTIADIDLSMPGSPSLVMRDLSEYITLPYLATFDVQPSSKNVSQQTPQKHIMYIGVSKKTMPMLVELFLRFKSSVDIYVDGTLEFVLSAYSIPVKLKYDCPVPSKYGKDLPLWKTATTCFLRIVKECTLQIDAMGKQITDERIEGIWRQILDVFRGGILADCLIAETFPLEVQESEENFDLVLIASLEIDVVPHLAISCVPDVLVAQLGKILL